ncbi:MAG: glycerol-3-phosphate acyltransferase [Chloroflexota bacterium]
MQIVLAVLALFVSYLIGSIPFGLIIVRLRTGKDIRQVESGRTGGTNAMRAAGFGAGLLTAILDLLKSASAVWLVRWSAGLGLLPGSPWLEVFAPLMAILGHNYSIFLHERDERGRLRLRGGAGGAPSTGGALGLWAPSILFVLPVGVFVLFGVGYASLATMSAALTAAVVFAYRAWIGASPWEYIFYGILAEVLLIWALRPNIRRLLSGTERVVGIRAWLKNKTPGSQD